MLISSSLLIQLGLAHADDSELPTLAPEQSQVAAMSNSFGSAFKSFDAPKPTPAASAQGTLPSTQTPAYRQAGATGVGAASPAGASSAAGHVAGGAGGTAGAANAGTAGEQGYYGQKGAVGFNNVAPNLNNDIVPQSANATPTAKSAAPTIDPFNNLGLDKKDDGSDPNDLGEVLPSEDVAGNVPRMGPGDTNFKTSIYSDSKFVDDPNFAYEMELYAQHLNVVKESKEAMSLSTVKKQPANHTESCTIESPTLYRHLTTSKSLVFWEGSCLDGKADGLGRVYVTNGKRKIFEMLAQFYAHDPDQNAIYYIKNTTVESQTAFFYGVVNLRNSNGISILKNNQNGDIVVSLVKEDYLNQIFYRKQTSKFTPYVLNILDFVNYAHYIHDLNHTPYRSLFMSYKLSIPEILTYGYSFIALKNGELKGTYTNERGESKDSEIPSRLLEHVDAINNEVEKNISYSLQSVIDAYPTIENYLYKVCDKSYKDELCNRMRCKQICNSKNTLTPNDPEVTSLLLVLVDHHHHQPLKNFIKNEINLAKEREARAMDDANREDDHDDVE